MILFVKSGYTKGIMLHDDVSFLIDGRYLNIYETFYTCCLRMFAFSRKTALSYFIFQMICNAKNETVPGTQLQKMFYIVWRWKCSPCCWNEKTTPTLNTQCKESHFQIKICLCLLHKKSMFSSIPPFLAVVVLNR